jgi:hypothetical protein
LPEAYVCIKVETLEFLKTHWTVHLPYKISKQRTFEGLLFQETCLRPIFSIEAKLCLGKRKKRKEKKRM